MPNIIYYTYYQNVCMCVCMYACISMLNLKTNMCVIFSERF